MRAGRDLSRYDYSPSSSKSFASWFEFGVDAPANVERAVFIDAVGRHAHLRCQQYQQLVADIRVVVHRRTAR